MCCAGLNAENKSFKVFECRFARRFRQGSGRANASRAKHIEMPITPWQGRNILEKKGIKG
jgi:hypothetical protein